MSWLSLQPPEAQNSTWNSTYNRYDNTASLTGYTPDDLAVYTDFTFNVKAVEKGADLDNLTTEQYNDREFVYEVASNPDCVSPAQPSCP